MPLAQREFDFTVGSGWRMGATTNPPGLQLHCWAVPVLPATGATRGDIPPGALLEMGHVSHGGGSGQARGSRSLPAALELALALPPALTCSKCLQLPEPACGAGSTKPAPALAEHLPPIDCSNDPCSEIIRSPGSEGAWTHPQPGHGGGTDTTTARLPSHPSPGSHHIHHPPRALSGI